ncbi:short-chain dehydrogenase, partial [Nocardia elegans]|nr:short-chain dehydrogenase [Nocardia elegans]
MPQSSSLANKTAIVTGGATLFGAAVVEELVAAGARVVLADLDDAAGPQVAQRTG